LRAARVYYLIFGKQGADPKVQQGLTSAAGFLRNALSKSLMIRYTPTLTFELDTTIEHGVRLTQLIDSLKKPEGAGVETPAVETPGAGPPGAATDEHDHIIDEG
jgi:ribosome-binding factor A